VTETSAYTAGLAPVVDPGEGDRHDRDAAFLMVTSEALRTARDATALAAQATQALATHLSITRCAFMCVDEAADQLILIAEFHQSEFRALPSTMSLSSHAQATTDQRAGHTTVICDTAIDERSAARYEAGYRPFGIAASINVPLLRDGRWVATLAVADASPRSWTQREIALVQTVAERIWPWLEHLRRSAEHREIEARELRLFCLAVEAAATGMILIDGDGRVVLVNSRTETLFGYSREELIGAPLEMLIPERYRATHAVFRSAFFTSPSVRPMGVGRDLFGRRKDGSEVAIEIGLSPLRTAQGDFVLSTIVDITERKRAEAERQDLVNRLETLNLELEERVAIRTGELSATLHERDVLLQEVHHRVKNNLQVISSLISMQMRKLEAGRSRDALEECQTRVDAIALIHERLYQSGDYSKVEFAEYVRSLATSVFHATRTAPSRVNLETVIDDVALGVDTAIPCGLVLNELITNALKHAFRDGRSGKVQIELAKIAGGRLRLAVTDNGIGLPPDLNSRQEESLGLRLVHTLARQLKAELVVRSDGGASFELSFPVTRSSQVAVP
jgi:two-component system, sensor histidine kinase PdtaS